MRPAFSAKRIGRGAVTIPAGSQFPPSPIEGTNGGRHNAIA